MEMSTFYQKYLDLLQSVSKHEEDLADEIAEFAKKKEWETVKKRTEQARKIEAFRSKLLAAELELGGLIPQEDNPDDEEAETGEQSLSERTSWEIDGDSIRVITKKTTGKEYSNVLSIDLFIDLVQTALPIIKTKGYVKVSDVFEVKKEYIKQKSDYQKTPRLTVYVSFKVLMKEGYLTKASNNSHRYLLDVPETDVLDFLTVLKSKVSK